jgi:hypothetical protein
MEASVNKHKKVKTSWSPLPSSSGKGSSCPDGRYKVLCGNSMFFFLSYKHLRFSALIELVEYNLHFVLLHFVL